MRQRSFGDTDLHASEIAFGTWALGSDWWGKTDDPARLIGRALELGITFFDTGDAYGQGANEEIVGRALGGVDRDRVQISTKFGYVLDSDRQQHSEGERPQDWSPQHAREALEASLRRLGVDHVDLYQLHNPRMDAIERLRFLVIPGERTMAQAALRFILAQPRMACVIPTVTSMAELEEFAGAADAPELTPEELARVDELYRSGFGLAASAA